MRNGFELVNRLTGLLALGTSESCSYVKGEIKALKWVLEWTDKDVEEFVRLLETRESLELRA